MFRMHKQRNDETANTTGDPELVLLRKMLTYFDGGSAADAPPAPEPDPVDSLAEMKRFVSEQRSAAEALLQELGAVEERLELQCRVSEANQAYLAAAEKAQQAKEHLDALRGQMLAEGGAAGLDRVGELTRRLTELKRPGQG
jgi:hypothetical protein